MYIPHRGRIAVGVATLAVIGLGVVLLPGSPDGPSLAAGPAAAAATATAPPGFTVHLDPPAPAATGSGSPGGPGGGANGAHGYADVTLETIDYLGHSFTVPSDWQIVDLAKNPATCVRFDSNSVYLGTPGTQEDCPASGIGQSTEAMLIQPAAGAPAGSVDDTTSRQISTVAQGVRITATYATDEAEVTKVIDTAGLPAPVAGAPVPSAGTAPLPDGATTPAAGPTSPAPDSGQSPVPAVGQSPAGSSQVTPGPPKNESGVAEMTRAYVGTGFDACTAPSAATMSAWGASPYGAVGIYIGGSARACAQPNLTAAWVAAEAQAGWHLLPVYAGPQVVDAGQVTDPAAQGAAAADDAAAQAQALGIGPGAVLYYDMEVASGAYTAAETAASTAFLAAWTTQLHQLGYLSAVYGNEDGSVGAEVSGWGGLVEPDVLDVGNWNSLQNDDPGADPAGDWNGRRVHQFVGNSNQTYGGVAINIDEDYLNLTGVGPSCALPGRTPGSGGGVVKADPIACL